MAEIRLSRGMVALVDDDNAHWLTLLSWSARPAGRSSKFVYAATTVFYDGAQHSVSMHRLVIAAPSGVGVDHINHNTLDNRRANLRLATQSQNIAHAWRFNRCGYRGVSQRGRRWRAYVTKNGQPIYCGSFGCPVEAARAYDRVSLEQHGEFAILNFAESGQQLPGLDRPSPSVNTLHFAAPVLRPLQ